MTFCTGRNNVKPTFRLVTFVVVVMLCLGGAIMALQSVRAGQFARYNSIIHGISGFGVFRMSNTMVFITGSLSSFTFLASSITFNRGFPFFCCSETSRMFATYFFAPLCLVIFFRISRTARFAFTEVSIFHPFINVKFRERLDFFAFGTSFGYDLLRHNQLLNSWLCSEPNTRPILVSGSLYCTQIKGDVKSFLKILKELRNG